MRLQSCLETDNTRWALNGLNGALALVTAPLALYSFVRLLPVLVEVSTQQDFTVYYLASKVLNLGMPLYDQAIMLGVAAEDGIPAFEQLPYVYPPFFAGLLRPVALLPHDTARTVWLVLNVLFLFASVALLVRIIGLPRWWGVPLSLASLLFPATYDTLLYGQVTVLLLLLVAGSLFFLTECPTSWRGAAAGAMLGIATGVKLFPALLAVELLLRRRIAALVGMVVSTLGTVVLGVVLGGGWEDTLRYIPQFCSRFRSSEWPIDQSVFSVFARLFSPHRFTFGGLNLGYEVTLDIVPLFNAPAVGLGLACLVSTVIVGATLSVLVVGSRRNQRDVGALGRFSLLLAAFLLVSPMWDYYNVLMLVPFFALLAEYRQSRSGVLLFGMLCPCFLFVLHRYWEWLVDVVVPSPLFLSLGFAGALVIWLQMLVLLLQPLSAGARPIAQWPRHGAE